VKGTINNACRIRIAVFPSNRANDTATTILLNGIDSFKKGPDPSVLQMVFILRCCDAGHYIMDSRWVVARKKKHLQHGTDLVYQTTHATTCQGRTQGSAYYRNLRWNMLVLGSGTGQCRQHNLGNQDRWRNGTRILWNLRSLK